MSEAEAALRAGYNLAAIGELLGHKYTQTTARYAHLHDDLAQEAATSTAGMIDGMMKAAPDKKTA